MGGRGACGGILIALVLLSAPGNADESAFPLVQLKYHECAYANGIPKRIKQIQGKSYCEAFIDSCSVTEGTQGKGMRKRPGPSEALCTPTRDQLSCEDADTCANDGSVDLPTLLGSRVVTIQEIDTDLCLDKSPGAQSMTGYSRIPGCEPRGKAAQERVSTDQQKPGFNPNRRAPRGGLGQ